MNDAEGLSTANNTCCRCSASGQVFSKYAPREGAEPVMISWTCANCSKFVCINCVLTEGTAPVEILENTLCSEECRAAFERMHPGDADADVSITLPSDLFATISRSLEEEGHAARAYDGEPRSVYINGASYQQLVALARDANVRPDEWIEAVIAKSWLDWKETLT